MMHHWRLRSDHPDDDVLAEAVAKLRTGGILAVPTETYYGLAAALDRPDALARIQQLKGRGPDKPLLLLVADAAMARGLARRIPPAFEPLVNAFWPGPLTLVLSARKGLPPAVVSATGGVAVRMSPDPVLRALLRRLGEPVSGTSANLGGHPPSREAGELEGMGGIDGILDAGRTPGGPPSTLLDLTSRPPRVLREGAVAARDLARVAPLAKS